MDLVFVMGVFDASTKKRDYKKIHFVACVFFKQST